MDITVIDCKTNGLYVDGRGMTQAAANTWHAFWHNYENASNHVFWHPAFTDIATYLVCLYGGGMIHPEGFRICVSEPHERLKHELDELESAMQELAEAIGFSYELRVGIATDVAVSRRYLFKTYNHEEGKNT